MLANTTACCIRPKLATAVAPLLPTKQLPIANRTKVRMMATAADGSHRHIQITGPGDVKIEATQANPIKVGDRVPLDFDFEVMDLGASDPRPVPVKEIISGKRAVLFAVPGDQHILAVLARFRVSLCVDDPCLTYTCLNGGRVLLSHAMLSCKHIPACSSACTAPLMEHDSHAVRWLPIQHPASLLKRPDS